MWWRRKRREPVRHEGQRLADRDTILFRGQSRRWSEMITEAHPVVGTDTVKLGRPYVSRWWRA